MQLEIHGQHLRVGDQIQEHIQRQMDFALGQFESWISGVAVHLEDVNGPRGGVDKCCRVLVGIKHGKTIKVEDIDVDFTVAINRVADRLRQVVGREVEKRREKKPTGKT
ncbi:MAG: HPF/RaiA family ribosome-associated protein [Pirellulales bacterium]|nr:HPF/RaiA family ribosome-associated protein [Pirellulales bacterium]